MSIKQEYDIIEKYVITAVLKGPLHIGDSSGDKMNVLVHPVDGVPFIQASSIAGLFRNNCSDPDLIYGAGKHGKQDDETSSSVVFTDGIIFKAGNQNEQTMPFIEIRPRVKINRKTGTVSNAAEKGTGEEAGQKFEMEYVGTGSKIRFSIYAYVNSKKNIPIKKTILNTLAALQNHDIIIGGQQSSGCGIVDIESIRYGKFDMKLPEDRKAWAKCYDDKYELKALKSEEWTQALADYDTDVKYRLQFTANTEGEMIVKAISVTGYYGEKEPDSENILNADDEFIIPGSSFKGAIRSQMEKIAGYMSSNGSLKDDPEILINNVFGYAGDNDDIGKHGVMRFKETVISRVEDRSTSLSSRIHIDKFTGGVMEGKLFTEAYVSGDGLSFEVDIKGVGNPEENIVMDKALGLLLMAVRDLGSKIYSLGGEYSIGKGFLIINEIKIYKRGIKDPSVVDFANDKVKDDACIIKDALKSLGENND